MKTKIFLITFLLVIPAVSGAQNDTSEQDSGILSSLPDVQITSADTYSNSTGEASGGQSTLNWIIVLGIAFLGVMLYSFDIDPKWIVLALGMIGAVYLLSYFGVIQP